MADRLAAIRARTTFTNFRAGELDDRRRMPSVGIDRATALRLLLAAALAVAVWLRLTPALVDFPVGDGGLFWVMAGELREASFLPPQFTAYNGGEIPWMYPPTGLYALAVLGGGLPLLQALPALFSLATLPAIWLLAKSMVGARGALFATAAYGLAPSAIDGLTSGGGVTRAPGVVLALLTMWAVVERRPAVAGVLGGLTILTHPLAAFYGGIGSAVLWGTRRPSRSMLVAPLIATVIGTAWFAPMVARHGFEALLGGLTSRGSPEPLGSLVLLSNLLLNPPTLAAVAGVVGIGIAWRQQRWDLLTWFALTALGVGVSGRWAIIPLALLAGLALDVTVRHLPSRRSVAMIAVAGVGAITGVLWMHLPRPVSATERATMEWVRDETAPGTVVAVIGYPADGGVVEWFPALSQRRNVTTAQGSEWLATGNEWGRAWEAVRCRDTSCLPAADLYVLSPSCCEQLASAMVEIGPDVFARRAP